MSYVEEFCEDIVILHHGDVVLQGNLKQIKKEYGYNRIVLAAGTLTPAQFEEKLVNSYSDLLSIYEKRSDCFIAELKEGVQKNDVLSRLLQDQIELDQFRIYEASLTDIFVSKAGDEE